MLMLLFDVPNLHRGIATSVASRTRVGWTLRKVSAELHARFKRPCRDVNVSVLWALFGGYQILIPAVDLLYWHFTRHLLINARAQVARRVCGWLSYASLCVSYWACVGGFNFTVLIPNLLQCMSLITFAWQHCMHCIQCRVSIIRYMFRCMRCRLYSLFCSGGCAGSTASRIWNGFSVIEHIGSVYALSKHIESVGDVYWCNLKTFGVEIAWTEL